MEFVFELNPVEKQIESLEQKLFDFNCAKVENYAYTNFLIKAMDDFNSMIAGIHARMGGGWMYIVSLWVDDNHRGKGIGEKLLRLAEETATKNNCIGAYLYTYSFQSPEFYKKFGYMTVGTLENFGGKHAKYFMKKKLT